MASHTDDLVASQPLTMNVHRWQQTAVAAPAPAPAEAHKIKPFFRRRKNNKRTIYVIHYFLLFELRAPLVESHLFLDNQENFIYLQCHHWFINIILLWKLCIYRGSYSIEEKKEARLCVRVCVCARISAAYVCNDLNFLFAVHRTIFVFAFQVHTNPSKESNKKQKTIKTNKPRIFFLCERHRYSYFCCHLLVFILWDEKTGKCKRVIRLGFLCFE